MGAGEGSQPRGHHLPAVALTPASPQRVERLVEAGVELVHLYADEVGYEQEGAPPRFLTAAIREVHERLAEAGLRDVITLVVSGGIAAAEHVPKALVCGADAVGVDLVLLVALGCALWADVRYPCPVEDEKIDPDWGAQRIVNLMAAWRDQLLEVLGAMGMREVRRLRGELGRAIFYKEEEQNFRRLFTRAKIPMTADQSPLEGEVEGDLRWTGELLQATVEQARTGKPPTSTIEHRVGRSGGGFDRLRFISETEGAWEVGGWESEIGDVDLSLELNRCHDGRPGEG